MSQPLPPLVSVVVPVHNEEGRISGCLEALLSQGYPASRYEIIVVDNGSTDRTREVVQRYPVACVEERGVRSSYAARNRGLEEARGEILAFTDSDCVPSMRWIEEGVRALIEDEADLAGGSVRFTFSRKPTGAELYDSVTNMQIERNVRERGVAKTANLFVRATVFEAVGAFPDDVRSGGDVTWTSHSTQRGFKLTYAERAEVSHPARKLGELMAKQHRVGLGQSMAWGAQGRSLLKSLAASVRFAALPDAPGKLRQRFLDRGAEPSRVQLARAWLAGYAARVATATGQVRGVLAPRRPTR